MRYVELSCLFDFFTFCLSASLELLTILFPCRCGGLAVTQAFSSWMAILLYVEYTRGSWRCRLKLLKRTFVRDSEDFLVGVIYGPRDSGL